MAQSVLEENQAKYVLFPEQNLKKKRKFFRKRWYFNSVLAAIMGFLVGSGITHSIKTRDDRSLQVAVLLAGFGFFWVLVQERTERQRKLQRLSQLNKKDITFLNEGIIYTDNQHYVINSHGVLLPQGVFWKYPVPLEKMNQFSAEIWRVFLTKIRYYNLSRHYSLKRAARAAIADLSSELCPGFSGEKSVDFYLKEEKCWELLKLKKCAMLLDTINQCETDDGVQAFIQTTVPNMEFSFERMLYHTTEEDLFLNHTARERGKTGGFNCLKRVALFCAVSSVALMGYSYFENPLESQEISKLFLKSAVASYLVLGLSRAHHLKRQKKRFEKVGFIFDTIEPEGFVTTDSATYFYEKVTRLTDVQIMHLTLKSKQQIVSLIDHASPRTGNEVSSLIQNTFLSPQTSAGQAFNRIYNGATLEEAAEEFGLSATFDAMNYLRHFSQYRKTAFRDVSFVRYNLVKEIEQLKEFIADRQDYDERWGEIEKHLMNQLKKQGINIEVPSEEASPVSPFLAENREEMHIERRILLLKNKPLHPKTRKMLLRGYLSQHIKTS